MTLEEIREKLLERTSIELAPKGIFNQKINEALDTIKEKEDANAALLSGLYLLNDDLVQSHSLSQSNKTQTGAYWHALMHRREPDFGNAKYWWGKTDAHPCFENLRKEVLEYLKDADHPVLTNFKEAIAQKWDAYEFTDLCEEANDNSSDLELLKALKDIQMIEIKNLLKESAK